jgi:hypothetical protein
LSEDMKVIAKTEGTLYWSIVIFSILNCLGLGGAAAADIFIVVLSSAILLVMAVLGLSRLKADLPAGNRHRYIFSTSYMAISLGISEFLIMISPYSVSKGLIVSALIAACGWIAIGAYSIARETLISRVVDWM